MQILSGFFVCKHAEKTLLLSSSKVNYSIKICKKENPHQGVSDSSSSSGDVGEVGVSSSSAVAVAVGN